MMHMISLHFVPLRCEWVYRPGSAKALVAVSDRDSPKVYIYDVYKTDAPISVLSSHAYVVSAVVRRPMMSMHKFRIALASTHAPAPLCWGLTDLMLWWCVSAAGRLLCASRTRPTLMLSFRRIPKASWTIGPPLQTTTGCPMASRNSGTS